jgi:hypothetical protein
LKWPPEIYNPLIISTGFRGRFPKVPPSLGVIFSDKVGRISSFQKTLRQECQKIRKRLSSFLEYNHIFGHFCAEMGRNMLLPEMIYHKGKRMVLVMKL